MFFFTFLPRYHRVDNHHTTEKLILLMLLTLKTIRNSKQSFAICDIFKLCNVSFTSHVVATVVKKHFVWDGCRQTQNGGSQKEKQETQHDAY